MQRNTERHDEHSLLSHRLTVSLPHCLTVPLSHCVRCNPTRRPLIVHTTTSTSIATPTTDTVNAVAPPHIKSFTSWKILIVATVVLGVNRKITTDKVVTARTNAVTKPVKSALSSIGSKISRNARKLPAPKLVAASSSERSICCNPAIAA